MSSQGVWILEAACADYLLQLSFALLAHAEAPNSDAKCESAVSRSTVELRQDGLTV